MANELHAKAVTDGPANEASQYLTFTLGEDLYAMGISTVREIIQHGAMTAVPLMPDFVRGVINLRGAVVPVIDMKVRFDRARSDVGKKTCVIIFQGSHNGEEVELGLMVDSVSEVIEIATSNIEPAPQFGTTIRRDFIHGIGKVNSEFIVVLDPARALDIDDMTALAEQALVA